MVCCGYCLTRGQQMRRIAALSFRCWELGARAAISSMSLARAPSNGAPTIIDCPSPSLLSIGVGGDVVVSQAAPGRASGPCIPKRCITRMTCVACHLLPFMTAGTRRLFSAMAI